MGKRTSHYAVIEDGEILSETLGDTPKEAIDNISGDRYGNYVTERAMLMSGRIRLHRVTVEIGDPLAPDEYPTEEGE